MTPRTKRRLEMARDLLKLDATLTPGQIAQHIQSLEAKERDSLRSCADWLEDYERHEGAIE